MLTKLIAPYATISEDFYERLIFSPLQQALGGQTWRRIDRQLRDYEYYAGKQHVNPATGQLVTAKEMPRPPELDYDPIRFPTNYFKSFIDKKARWLMGGQHGINVPTPQEPTPEQAKVAASYESLLYQLWRENKMRTSLTKAARDYLIARRVVCKIVFDTNTGKLRWVWRPDTEFVPVYSDEDMTLLIGGHFVSEREEDGRTLIRKESFTLEGGACYYEDAEYTTDLKRYRTITEKASMGIDFLPLVVFAVPGLSGEEMDTSEIEAMRAVTDRLNAMNEDAADSLKFEMFAMTALLNVPAGTAEKVQIAPGAVIEVVGGMGGTEAKPDVKRIEGTFSWSAAFDGQYSRLKAALHEITSLPNVVPQELNFGGLNGDALHVLFQSIIQETEEHWLEWQDGLQELHEKSIRYLKARLDRAVFAYDKSVVRSINDYTNEIKFVLPLPDNRKSLVELLTEETASGFESIAGAMRRLGVENVAAKKQEIAGETAERRAETDPYQGGNGSV
ncbi:phage portal protein (plasmid) [Paenibacillus sp. JNUCC32]|uniref:phage portal protein n=1 Tax=Paenibacillus sp. JNUCC32 TaxID=2777984 RepID=UPI001788103C|nr:phage portal protein [Paenibacillus sp. JNUCC-32]QOT13722.1 phage portal protein [Paenibacillus sp. JNUCC-32]